MARCGILLLLIISTIILSKCEGGGGQPFAAKASLLRFWRRALPGVGLPAFLLEKASPLNATSVALFSLYLKNQTLSNHIASFCTAAELLCTRTAVRNGKAVAGPSDFESYKGKEFQQYKADDNSFKNYSDNGNIVADGFKGYGSDSDNGLQVFRNYAPGSNVEDEDFATYRSGSRGGIGDFSSYGFNTNIPKHQFKNYGTESKGGIQGFRSYADSSNVNHNAFTTYGKDAGGALMGFTSYAKRSNVISNAFKAYDEAGNAATGGFTSYAEDSNVVTDSFKGYGGHSDNGLQDFRNYALGSNWDDEGFANYRSGSRGGIGDFSSYGFQSNVPNHHFKNYGTESNGDIQGFKSYADNSNAIHNAFTTYGKDANGALTGFTSYATGSNIISNAFKAYDQKGNGATGVFTSYAEDGNAVSNEFQNYAANANGGDESFTSYASRSSTQQAVFKSYGKDAHGPGITFTNYGKNISEDSSSEFALYAEGSKSPIVGFNSYGLNFTFKDYAKSGVTFSDYKKKVASRATGVEAGKFFRENLLVQGKTLPMPDIKDYMPKRSFLPASLANNLPFATQTLPELMKMFHIPENSTMSAIMARTLRECERAAVKSEIKKCVRSVEGMAEFAVSVLGSKVEILTTESTAGSGQNVSVGVVRGKDGGKVTRSVSCHQSLFPFLVYYCHSVPKVKVFQAELLSIKEKKKINKGVAICHLDTTQWSAKHAAFMALGHQPGEIEVCHLIFENDLIWVPLSA